MNEFSNCESSRVDDRGDLSGSGRSGGDFEAFNQPWMGSSVASERDSKSLEQAMESIPVHPGDPNLTRSDDHTGSKLPGSLETDTAQL